MLSFDIYASAAALRFLEMDHRHRSFPESQTSDPLERALGRWRLSLYHRISARLHTLEIA
jgi:hypothetical protein